MSILSGSIPPRRCWSPAIAGAKACTGSTAIFGQLDPGTPVIMFQHFPVGRGHDYIDDQAALLGLFAGHIHREIVTRRHGPTQVTLKAFADGPSCYWAETAEPASGWRYTTARSAEIDL